MGSAPAKQEVSKVQILESIVKSPRVVHQPSYKPSQKKTSLSQSSILGEKSKFSSELDPNNSAHSDRKSELGISRKNKIKSVRKLPLQNMPRIQSQLEEGDVVNTQRSVANKKQKEQYHKLIRIYDLN